MIKSSKLLTGLFLTVVLMTASLGFTIPESNALVKRDFSYRDDQHLTASTGNTKVCGNHLCTPGEWKKLHDPSAKSPIPLDKKGFIIPKKIKKVTTL